MKLNKIKGMIFGAIVVSTVVFGASQAVATQVRAQKFETIAKSACPLNNSCPSRTGYYIGGRIICCMPE